MSLLEARNLDFSYGSTTILRDVSLQLSAGEIVALLGPNGAGKSTLLRVLLGQIHGSGQVVWDGREVRSWTRRDLARRVAYLPQSPSAEPEQSVLDVLRAGRAPYWGAFGLESARDVRVVEEIARNVGLSDLQMRPMAELSGGQRQLVFLARCLVQEPAALLLDEPNTFLDLKHQVDLFKMLRRLATEKRMAVLMASHDLNLAAMSANRLLLLEAGTVAAEGAPEKVLQTDLLSRVYGTPLQRVVAGNGRIIVLPEIGEI